MSDKILAFEGAEGFGANTIGGRGGQIVKVTTLEDSGPGSLRWALEDVSGPRTVVFEVNGAIHLKDQIVIEDPNVTIAGQTALGDGITIEGSRIRVKADDVIIRGLKFRPGDGAEGMKVDDRDGLFIGTTDFTIDNVIVDHNSFTWGVDENLSVNGKVQNITISNNLIAEGLSHSIHSKGEHSKGLLISNWGSNECDVNTNISIVKNLFASNMQRNPEIRAGQDIEVVNNYIYNYGLAHTALFIGAGSGGTLATTVHAIGNVFDPGPDTPNYKKPIALSTMGEGSAVLLQDNIWTKIGSDAEGNQSQLKMAWDAGGLRFLADKPIFTSSHISILDSQDVKAYVLANVGASPHQRDAVDARIVASSDDKTGRIVDSVAEAGGPVANVAVRHATDSDDDGMPNWFEDVYGLDRETFNANGDKDGDGYTNIEEYINGLITGFNLPEAGVQTVLTAETGVAESIVVGGADSVGRTIIRNFSAEEGDRLDVSQLLTAYDPALDRIADFVEAVTVAGRTVVSIDRDGAGSAYTMKYVAELESAGPFGSLADVLIVQDLVAQQASQKLTNVRAVDDQIALNKNGTLVLPNGILTLNDQKTGIGSLSISAVFEASNGAVTLDEFGQIVFKANDDFTGRASFAYRLAEAEGDQGVGRVLVDVRRDLIGTASNDVMNGGQDWANVSGGDGSDIITTGGGDDIISGDAGNDNIVAGAGNDLVSGGANADRLVGGAGNDALYGDDGDDTLYGEVGEDLIEGGLGNDQLHGGDGNDTLRGAAGNDVVRSGAGDDRVYGNDGNDAISGEAGNDLIEGGAGNDSLTGGDGTDLVSGGEGADIIALGNGDDTGYGDAGNDSLNGEAGNDVLWGGAGDDKLDGLAGNDVLYGGEGVDVLNGGDGIDWLFGGAGADRLVGGAGADIFAVERSTGFDTIVDFVKGADKIALLASNLGMDDLDLGHNLFIGIGIGAKAMSQNASVIYDQRSGALSFDADGSGSQAAIMIAQLSSRAVLTESDFMLV